MPDDRMTDSAAQATRNDLANATEPTNSAIDGGDQIPDPRVFKQASSTPECIYMPNVAVARFGATAYKSVYP
jgi:hypothetical protein